jgi:hypothetical protein
VFERIGIAERAGTGRAELEDVIVAVVGWCARVWMQGGILMERHECPGRADSEGRTQGAGTAGTGAGGSRLYDRSSTYMRGTRRFQNR